MRKRSTPPKKEVIDPKSPKGLGRVKLAESGLTLEDAAALGITFLTPAQTKALRPQSKSFFSLASLRLNYFDHAGKPLMDIPGAPPFYRIRYLEKSTEFDALVKEDRFAKYVQEPYTVPCAYWPKNFNWSAIINNVDEPVIFTEGELKSAKACKEGFATIGICGVFNWKSHKLGIEWLPSLEPLNLVRRNVYVCFDSDYKFNAQVCVALMQFARALQERGALVHLVTLPQLDNVEYRTGLDDFLVNAGVDANEQFAALLRDATPLGLCKPLWTLNERYCYVQDPGLIVDQKTAAKTAPSAFTGHLQSTKTYQERELKDDGTVSYKATSAATAWLKWPLRTEVNRLTYRPGRDKIITDGCLPAFNIWSGWGVEPKKGSAKPFIELVSHIFTGADEGAMKWFLDWAAYPLQNPGTKLFSSTVIHGIIHGTGKSLIGYTLGKVYGKNFSEISQMDLHNSFNEWAEAKQFVMGDDVTGSNKRADADFLKKLITQQELRVNPKYVASYVVPDCINYFFTSNSPDSFFLEDHDRRFFIHEVLVGPRDPEFYAKYTDWLYNKDGAAIVFDYLLKRDLNGFNPAAPALMTQAKDRMINTVQSDLGAWARQLRATPDGILKIGKIPLKRDLYTSKELLEMFYDPTGKTGTTANGLGRELQRAGFRQVRGGKLLRTSGGLSARYYVIRNAEKWLKEDDPGKLVRHVEGADATPEKKKKY